MFYGVLFFSQVKSKLKDAVLKLCNTPQDSLFVHEEKAYTNVWNADSIVMSCVQGHISLFQSTNLISKHIHVLWVLHTFSVWTGSPSHVVASITLTFLCFWNVCMLWMLLFKSVFNYFKGKVSKYSIVKPGFKLSQHLLPVNWMSEFNFWKKKFSGCE